MLRPSGGLGASDHQQASDENAVIFNYAVIRHCLHKELLRITHNSRNKQFMIIYFIKFSI